MQQTFIQAYAKLSQPKVATAGLWLAQGDEPLLQQWLIDDLRDHWQHELRAIKRFELVSAKSWHEVMSELGTQSLFDDASALIVTGNHKPDKAIISEIEHFATDIDERSHSLLWLLPKVDKKSQASKWLAPFIKFGHVIDCNLYDERGRQQILQLKAERFGLRLSSDAWQLLISHTEHNLLGAYQTLWRLSYLFAPQIAVEQSGNATSHPVAIDIEDLQAALVSDAQFSVFDLSDAMLAGNSVQVVKIMQALQDSDEPATLVLWAISKDMRAILALMDGKDPQSLGIWRSKQGLYQNACRRQSRAQTKLWFELLYRCDSAVKGVIAQNPWELLLQAALLVTGKSLFSPSQHF